MPQVKIYLNKELNTEYFSIMEEYNSLMDKWNNVNNQLHSFKVPTLFLVNTKRKLTKIGEAVAELQKEYLAWNKKATNFLINPSYRFDDDQQAKELTYTHFTDMMQHTINFLESHMKVIVGNYNDIYSSYKYQININIAISAFLISIIGLIVSLFAVYKSQDLEAVLNEMDIPKKIEKIDNTLLSSESKIDSLSNYTKTALTEIDSSLQKLKIENKTKK